MIVERFMFSNGQEVNSFLAACPETGQGMIIDAGGLDKRLQKIVEEKQITVTRLFITHDHYDHTEAVDKILSLFPGIELISFSYGYGSTVRKTLDGEEINLGNLNGKFLHIPGHTEDMMVLYFAGHLFSGDALFAGSVGGTSSEEAYRLQIKGIKEKILCFPDETLIHPGHGPDSTVGLERSFNPFL